MQAALEREFDTSAIGARFGIDGRVREIRDQRAVQIGLVGQVLAPQYEAHAVQRFGCERQFSIDRGIMVLEDATGCFDKLTAVLHV